ncbi:hypothetical protein EW146_g3537 [Bondarzewia mesenterica]|uniref:Calcium uniporter protein, mitochondrial n=1 Tax=Bondarzewia mesenterica TaxID=1095465 RepID=A0A4S4LXH0_9AGAM|nr:hypothetical protein EW146_g3537 [Bondarzewia mesenterica]
MHNPSPAFLYVSDTLRPRFLSTTGKENLSVAHARFLAEANPSSKWTQESHSNVFESAGTDGSAEEVDRLTEGKGKLSPTSSHLFKLILPLGAITATLRNGAARPASVTEIPPPTVFLLHPSQPLSHVNRLIVSSFFPAKPEVSFRTVAPYGQHLQWSDSTDLGDFIRAAARTTEFSIHISPSASAATTEDEGKDRVNTPPLDETVITIEIPTFAARTRFLRRRLAAIKGDLKKMEGLKVDCDREARRGARRMAVGGFGLLIVYWGAVARLTFWDYGWDVMEPITYLSGLSTVVCGYLWFLYQGREVSYSSVLDHSISARREALYKARGLDIERWGDLIAEARTLRREIGQIAQDYEQNWQKEKDEDVQASEEEGKEDKDEDVKPVMEQIEHDYDKAGQR